MSLPTELVLRAVEGDFADCRDILLDEIAERGIVLTFHSYVSAMLSRTAAVTGEDSPYINAEIVGFCKADVSARMVAADPHNIVFCPQAVFIYELRAEAGTIYLGYRKSLSADGAAAETEALLADIIDKVIEVV